MKKEELKLNIKEIIKHSPDVINELVDLIEHEKKNEAIRLMQWLEEANVDDLDFEETYNDFKEATK